MGKSVGGGHGQELTAKEATWRQRMVQWEQSDLAQAAFCRRYGLALSTFQWWRKRLGGPRPQSRNEAARPRQARHSAFIPVRMKADSAGGTLVLPVRPWACEVANPSGVTVRLRECPSVARLGRLAAALAGEAQ